MFGRRIVRSFVMLWVKTSVNAITALFGRQSSGGDQVALKSRNSETQYKKIAPYFFMPCDLLHCSCKYNLSCLTDWL